MKMLQPGDLVPHFDVQTVHGDVFRYSAIWQSKNLVLVTLPAVAGDDGYVRDLMARAPEFDHRHAACIVTREGVPGLPAPGGLVADRWGEIVYLTAPSQVASLPTPQELLDWVEYLENRCPECEGEAR
jgi:hypothetical protein